MGASKDYCDISFNNINPALSRGFNYLYRCKVYTAQPICSNIRYLGCRVKVHDCHFSSTDIKFYVITSNVILITSSAIVRSKNKHFYNDLNQTEKYPIIC